MAGKKATKNATKKADKSNPKQKVDVKDLETKKNPKGGPTFGTRWVGG